MMDSRYEDILELYYRINNPINTSSIVKMGHKAEWVDSVADICSLKEELKVLVESLKGV